MTLTQPTPRGPRKFLGALVAALLASSAACDRKPPADRVRVSGQIEATDVQVAPQVGGRILELRAAEGDHLNAGDIVARLDQRLSSPRPRQGGTRAG